MRVKLGDTWELTDEHAAASQGQPVLVDTETGTTYEPRDHWGEPGQSGRCMAVEIVDNLKWEPQITREELAFCDTFHLPRPLPSTGVNRRAY